MHRENTEGLQQILTLVRHTASVHVAHRSHMAQCTSSSLAGRQLWLGAVRASAGGKTDGSVAARGTVHVTVTTGMSQSLKCSSCSAACW
jgi:hypothetical protein